jgi:hypothetical protein
LAYSSLRIDYISPEVEARFWQQVDRSQGDESCWLWTGPKRFAYGVFSLSTRRGTGAHRISWLIHNGPLAEGMHVLHKCDNPLCVNPAHLWSGTHQDNMRDRMVKNRTHRPIGELSSKCKLTADQVREIVKLLEAGYSHRTIGKMYGVNSVNITAINRGKSWLHITGIKRGDSISARAKAK